MNRRSPQHSSLLFWGLPVLSGIGIATVVLTIGRHGLGTVGGICIAVLVVLPPAVVGVHASRRGLPEDRVGMLIIKSVALTVVVLILTGAALLPIFLREAFGGT